MTPIMLAEAREIPDRTAATLTAQAPLLDDIADRLRRAEVPGVIDLAAVRARRGICPAPGRHPGGAA